MRIRKHVVTNALSIGHVFKKAVCLCVCLRVLLIFFQFMKEHVQFNQNYQFSGMEAEELELLFIINYDKKITWT